MSEAVTIVVRRRVKPGSEAAYEDWLHRLIRDAANLSGYLGTQIHKPGRPSDPYVSVFRFASLEELENFERSELRARYLKEVAPLVAADAVWDKITGLEIWFEAPKGTVTAQPSPHRMALVLIVVVFVLVLTLNVALTPLIGDWPLALRLLVTVILQVGLMTYVIMPRLTRLLASWIFPTTKTVT